MKFERDCRPPISFGFKVAGPSHTASIGKFRFFKKCCTCRRNHQPPRHQWRCTFCMTRPRTCQQLCRPCSLDRGMWLGGPWSLSWLCSRDGLCESLPNTNTNRYASKSTSTNAKVCNLPSYSAVAPLANASWLSCGLTLNLFCPPLFIDPFTGEYPGGTPACWLE